MSIRPVLSPIEEQVKKKNYFQTLSAFRWWVSRHVFSSKLLCTVPYVGLVSTVELGLFAVAILIAVLMSLTQPTSKSGNVASHFLTAGLVIVFRKNYIVSHVLGISWERALIYHKAFSMASIFGGVMHGLPKIIAGGGFQKLTGILYNRFGG